MTTRGTTKRTASAKKAHRVLAAQAVPRKSLLYLYGISRGIAGNARVQQTGVDGLSQVATIACRPYLCWVSPVAADEFGENLATRMENLEWLAEVSLRHQQVVAEVAARATTLPARFGTVFLSETSLLEHVQQRSSALEASFERVADADEWGVKVFQLGKPRQSSESRAATGAEYLKRKAEMRQPTRALSQKELEPFERQLKDVAADFHPGAGVSAGQPGLVWHGSFLVKRDKHDQFHSLLRHYAERWHGIRRIDCSGPWPPYSFVGDSA